MGAALSDAVAVLLENPFSVTSERLSAAISTLARRRPMDATVRSTLERDGSEAAERLVLAIAHGRACVDPDDVAHLLGQDALPVSVARALPHPRSAYVALGAAGGRCLRVLQSLQGTSSALSAVRRATWAACFGDSLLHALVLARVIHDHDVLILGETGTGKEAIAHAIQEGCIGPKDGSPAPRAALNAAAVPETLVAAELFGHVKGAYTGASEARVGRIRSAYGGSFFLDEVGDLGLSTQVKLLRVIETDEVSPLGSDRTYPASCRYLAATHKDLEAMVEAGQFRRDLHQRLAGSVIRLPPLRERPEDIVTIGHAFVERHLPSGVLPRTRRRIEVWLGSEEARRHRWPGNVRELQNALRNLLLGLEPEADGQAPLAAAHAELLPGGLRDCTATMDQVVDWYVRRVHDHSGENLARAARILAVDRTTVRRRLRSND
jgi:two-component system response regulator HydG